MNLPFQDLMKKATQEATRLVHAGDLKAATARLQEVLRGATAPLPTPGTARWPASAEVIDVEVREVPATAAGAAAAEPAAQPAAPSSTRREPRGDVFVSGHHQGRADQRDFKLYIPPQAGARPLPLVVMLHGCTQDPDDFAAGTGMNDAARAEGFFVLYPAQSQRANPQRCWNWFKHSHQQRDRGEPALLAGMVRQVMAEHAVDADQVYVAGLSAGGAMAAILGEAYPDLFAAVGVHSGLAAGSATDLPAALSAMNGQGTPCARAPSGVPTIVFHGDGDSTVHPRNGDDVVNACAGAGGTVAQRVVQQPGGRRSTVREVRGADGEVLAEHWTVHGAAHAWSGGSAKGSYTDPKGPDATAALLRFFFARRRRRAH